MNDINKENEVPSLIRKPSKKYVGNNIYNLKLTNDKFKNKNKFNIGLNTSLNANFDKDSIDRFTLSKKRVSYNTFNSNSNKVTKHKNNSHSELINIKPSDSPEKQFQAISDCIFKREIQMICENGNDYKSGNISPVNLSKMNSPERVLHDLITNNSPTRSRTQSPHKYISQSPNKYLSLSPNKAVTKSPNKYLSQSPDRIVRPIFSQDDLLIQEYINKNQKLKKINKKPIKILDAPDYSSDIKLSLLKYNKNSVLCVVLNNFVYLLNETINETINLDIFDKERVISNINWCDDDIHLLIGYEGGNIELYDTDTYERKRDLVNTLNDSILNTCWVGQYIVTGTQNGIVSIHDVSKRHHLIDRVDIVQEFNLKKGTFVSGVCLNESSNKIVIGMSNGCTYFYDFDLKEKKFIYSFKDTLSKSDDLSMIKAIEFNPIHSNIVATGNFNKNNGLIKIYDIKKKMLIKKIETGVQITSLHWHYEYKTQKFEIIITCGDPNNSIAIYDYNTSAKVAEIEKAHLDPIITSSMNTKHGVIVTVSKQENLCFFKLYDVKNKPMYNSTEFSKDTLTMK
ncbi:hypothetical protein ACO0R3_003785 [Hanseniaspora guilliermondii]